MLVRIIALAIALPVWASPVVPEATRINELQVIGSHNSYKLAIEPKLEALMRLTAGDRIDSIDYAHIPLRDQLELGLRNLEIDVYHDPVGGMYNDPLGHRIMRAAGQEPEPWDEQNELDTPGFKVLHDADFDFRTSCYDLTACLAELRAWSKANPDHAPIVVTINPKTGTSDRPGATEVAPFTSGALAELDRTILTAMERHRVITPDDVRGDHPTLERAVLDEGWPTLDRAAGRFIFVWDAGGSMRDLYTRGRPSLEGRAMFAPSQPGSPAAAFFIINDPVRDQHRIAELVARGYMVRTRSDAGTAEARENSYDRFEAAKASGAQVITTDFYIPDRSINDTFQIRFDDGGFARANPVAASTRGFEPAPTAGDIDNPAILEYRITDDSGQTVPSRLTFVAPDGSYPELFPITEAAPDKLALRKNVVYSLAGEGAITVPAGTYTVYASRGMEYSIDSREITLRPGQRSAVGMSLAQEVDTSGWISGDFHLHTLTYSGHGDSNMPERIISIVGEGLDFAVATDHNHHTDYDPIIEHLGAGEHLTAVVGNEISTPIGHINAFPLESGRLIPYRMESAKPLFKIIRDEPNAFGITPVIQINHPRWGGIAYYDSTGLDPLTGTTESDAYSDDYDSIEIFNENEGFGYYDPETPGVGAGSQTASVLRDWFNLLNRGSRYAAVGNSDSHDVRSEVAAIPRNYLPSPTDNPADIDPRDVAEAIKDKRVFTTTGPFVDFAINDEPMGGQTLATNAKTGPNAFIDLRVQAASWIDCDRVKIVVNGDIVQTLDVPQIRTPVRLEDRVGIRLDSDAWVCLLVEGDDAMAPIIHDQTRPIRPITITNPVWIDADRDGQWTSPFAQARQHLAHNRSPWMILNELKDAPASERLLTAQALSKDTHLGSMIAMGLMRDDDPGVRVSAVRAAGKMGDAGLIPVLRDVFASAGDDRTSIAAVRALAECGADDADELLIAALRRPGSAARRAELADLLDLAEGDYLRDWSVVGFFPNAGPDQIDTALVGPDLDPDAATFSDAKGGSASWQPIEADSRGFVDLRSIDSNNSGESVSFARRTLSSDHAREVIYTFGADDGSLVRLNGENIYVEKTQHGANPLQHVGVLSLKKGDNELVVKVENGGGDHGFYFRVLDDALARPNAASANYQE